MQPFCEVLENAEHDKEILDLLTRIQRLVCETPPKKEKKTGQTPEIYYNSHVQLRIQHIRCIEKAAWQSNNFLNRLEFHSDMTADNAVLPDGIPKLDKCLNEYYSWDKTIKGHATIIKTHSSFNVSDLKKAINENLDIETVVVESNKDGTLAIDSAIQNGKNWLIVFKCL